MSYLNKNPNGVLYAGTVKWSNDYKHVMLFANRNARNTFLENNLSLVRNKLIYVNPNAYVDIKDKIENAETINYVYYKNDSDFSNTHFCCFVTSYEYVAPRTTRLYLEIDIFQMFFYTANFYQSYIERAIVSNAENLANTNYLPEPVSAPLNYEKELSVDERQSGGANYEIISQDDWQPYWVLHMASRYNHETEEYDYGGVGDDNTFGEYGRYIETVAQMEGMLALYGRMSPQQIAQRVGAQQGQQSWADWVKDVFMASTGVIDLVYKVMSVTSVADLQDHRNELIGLYAIPKWLHDKHVNGDSTINYATNKRVSSGAITLKLNISSLANGYTPRNKKLLTSICRGYVLANRTGLKVPFKPELFTTNSPTITLYGIPMSTGGYQYSISGYADRQLAHGEVSYSSERRVGYDANTGLNKVINAIGAGNQILQSAGQIAGGVVKENPLVVSAGVSSLTGSMVSAIDAIGQSEGHIGSNGDLLRVTGGRPVLRWFEINPSVSECQAIDNFFDMYGYSIHEHKNPSQYFNNRSQWNYVKTNGVNMQANAPANYENKLKEIFNSGVTLWHNYATFGDYSQTNS